MSARLIATGCIMCLLSLVLTSTLSAGLVAWWKLDEGSGTTAGDASGTGKDGTLNGGATWVEGKEGKGVYLDGVDDYIQVPNFVGQTGTLAFWFRPDWSGTDPEDYRIFDASTSTIYFFIAKGADHADINPEDFGFYLEDGTDADYQGIEADPAGFIFAQLWMHIVVTWQFGGGPAVLYVDGQEIARAPSLGPLPTLDPNPRFGLQTVNYIPSRHGATGVIDDIRVYDRVLEPVQAKDLFNGVAPDWRKAQQPEPADGALNVAAPLLRWVKGETAMFHDVYLGTSPELTEADRVATRLPLSLALYYHIPGLTAGARYYWRVDEIEKDGVTTHTGDVWTFVMQALTAYYPSPADQATTASPTPTLTWMPGAGAVQHQVYFGDNVDDVTQGAADTDKGTFAAVDTVFAPGELESLKTYFWRVDEIVAGGTLRTGAVWSFTTYAVIDDFESYTDDEGSRIYETWVDGWTNDTGSTVGYVQAPFAEQTIVHDANQSMPLDYNNVDSPFYSEAQRTFSPAEDWTAGGTDALLVYIRGRGGNGAAPLYLVVEDSGSRKGTVVHADAAVVRTGEWLEWRIPFATFADADVNLTAVKKLTLGVGDPANPVAGPRGLLYIDDIARAKSPPAP